MDIIDIGAALAITGGAATAASEAATNANTKAGLADAAAEAANAAAAAYGTLASDAETVRIAMNWWHMDMLAETRDMRNRVTELEEQAGEIEVSGSTPTITAKMNRRYICGTVSTISFTPSAKGICAVRFTSGTSAAVLTVPDTVKWPSWFNPLSLNTDTVYELCVSDGVYGTVGAWT